MRCHALLAALCAVSPVLSADDKVAALVNGEQISVAELDASLADLPAAGTTRPEARKQLRAEALQLLIDDRLVRQFLKDHGPRVPAIDVERQYAALVASQKAEGKTIEAYLKELGLTSDQVKESFALMLSLARYVEQQATDEALRKYFDENRAMFDRTTVRASHVVRRVGPGASEADKEQARSRLRAVRADLAAGKLTFATAARTYSQCATGLKDGDLGFIVRKFQVEEAVARAAFSMRVGEVSDLVESETGFHLVWVTDRKEGKPVRYEDVSREVRDCFEAELKLNLVNQLRKKARIDIKLAD